MSLRDGRVHLLNGIPLLQNGKPKKILSYWNSNSIGFNLMEHVPYHIVKKERPSVVLAFATGCEIGRIEAVATMLGQTMSLMLWDSSYLASCMMLSQPPIWFSL